MLDAVVTADIPVKDGCPVLTRLKGFLVPEGMAATLQFQFTDGNGRPVNLNPLTSSDSSAPSASESNTTDQAILRLREYLGFRHPEISQVVGEIIDADTGVVQAEVPEIVYRQAGVYMATWGFRREGKLVAAYNGVLLIERSLFGFDESTTGTHTEGPPTIDEIRVRLRDSHSSDNLLLREVEFSQVEIASALVDPVRYFNENPPPLPYLYDTTNFPFQNEWIDAAIGRLYLAAASNYRRNRLGGSAGGQTIDDMNKEREYLAAAELHDAKWRNFVYEKKLQLNAAECILIFGSDYDGSD